MPLFKSIYLLLRKELLLEMRQKYAISGILLYVLSTVFIVYTAFIRIPANTWNVVFWIIILFASVNAIAKSFVQENTERQLYYYQLASPLAIILSKIIYNSFLLFSLSLLTFAVLSIIADNPVRKAGLFWQAMILGSLGFSIAFTFISAIASKTSNSATLMAILGFPVVIPILATLIKISADALGLINDTSVGQDIFTLLAIDGILVAVALVLFPFLWRD